MSAVFLNFDCMLTKTKGLDLHILTLIVICCVSVLCERTCLPQALLMCVWGVCGWVQVCVCVYMFVCVCVFVLTMQLVTQNQTKTHNILFFVHFQGVWEKTGNLFETPASSGLVISISADMNMNQDLLAEFRERFFGNTKPIEPGNRCFLLKCWKVTAVVIPQLLWASTTIQFHSLGVTFFELSRRYLNCHQLHSLGVTFSIKQEVPVLPSNL